MVRRVLFGLLVILAAFTVGGAYWVFALGAAQPDGPPLAEHDHAFQLETYESHFLHQKRTYGIYLPAGYDVEKERRYPTVYLLHGGHGKASDWFIKADAIDVVDRLTKSGELPPCIVIAPDGNDARGSSPLFDPEYIDGANGKVLSSLGSELVNVIDQRYRTRKDRQFRALGGLSSGGWGAMNIGLHFPQTFGVLFSHSGYFTFTGQQGKANSPLALIETLSPKTLKSIRIYLDAGSMDGEFLDSTRTFAKRLEAKGNDISFHEFPGGHGIVGPDTGWNYWHKHLTDSLRFVGQQFAVAEQPS